MSSLVVDMRQPVDLSGTRNTAKLGVSELPTTNGDIAFSYDAVIPQPPDHRTTKELPDGATSTVHPSRVSAAFDVRGNNRSPTFNADENREREWVMIDRSSLTPLFVLVLAQLFGTSLWFSINGVWHSLSHDLGLAGSQLGSLTLVVQGGFIIGTLLFASTGLADRFGASRIFAVSSVLGSLMNAGFVMSAEHAVSGLLLRFATGLCLAGIYPLGMKLVISWTPKYAGAALAWLLGMLTLGTALPHLMRGATSGLPWEWTLLGSSALALVGGGMVFMLGDGPHLPKNSGPVPLRQGLAALRTPRFRSVAGGYFGHCWELYAVWLLIPLLAGREISRLGLDSSWVSWLAFAIIGIGALGCVGGGWLSRSRGSEWVARWALRISGLICLLYPWLSDLPPLVLIAILFIWGLSVIADSPQFSALAAQAAPRAFVGSSLAVMNAVGFALTIPAIWLTAGLWNSWGAWVTLLLLPGPVLGLLSLARGER